MKALTKKEVKSPNLKHWHKLSMTTIAIGVLSACGGGGSDSGPTAPPAPVGSPPTVTVDERVIVSAGDSVTLTASAVDPDGDTINFSWSQVSGDSVANTTGFSSSSASFSAPSKVNSIEFEVTASANGQSDTERVQVIVLEDLTTAIFVDRDFTGTSDGSIDAPFSDLSAVIDNLTSDDDVYLKTPKSDNRYSLAFESSSARFEGGNSIYGGYSENWSRDVVNNKTPIASLDVGLSYANIDAPTVVSGLDLEVSARTESIGISDVYGILASSGSGELIIENNVINLMDFPDIAADSSRGTLYGLYLRFVETTLINHNTITTGAAHSANNRAERTSDKGKDGADGEDARVGLNIVGGDGGSGLGGWNGGKGGNAGNTSFEGGIEGQWGKGRSDSPKVKGGSPGSGGASTGGAGGNGGNGGNGEDGATGVTGNGASGAGRVFESGDYRRSQGGSGGNGFSGGGGGGGGGAAAGAAGANGGAGGGGGEGGTGGSGGYGGSSGGASIAIHLVGGSMHQIENNTLLSGDGGNGGIGGIGSVGGSGGKGGDGVQGTQIAGNAKGGTGGNGGKGGKGGRGGAGGSGAGGPSFGVFIGANTPATINDNTITTGAGGQGANSYYTNILKGAGQGGWSIAIFDGNPNDALTPQLGTNQITLGIGGEDGRPSEGRGESAETNFQ